jgi:hypothetical protein
VSVSFSDLFERSATLQSLLQNNDLSQFPLDLGLEREYKLQANRYFALQNKLNNETTSRYFDFEEAMLQMRSGRNIYALSQIETMEYKYFMLYDSRIFLNFKPYMTKDFVMCFFKNMI